MKRYIFYTPDGYTESPTNQPVENLQVLGQASGHNMGDALNSLLKNNQWITKNGFNENCIIGEQLLDESLKNNIKKIVEYLWTEEEKHYEENQCSNHIFLILKQLKQMIS